LLRIKRPLVAAVLFVILLIMAYDSLSKDTGFAYIGKTLSLTGRIKEIKSYDVPFGERSYRLKVKADSDEIRAFILKIKESDLFAGCNLQKLDGDTDISELIESLYGRKISCTGSFEAFDGELNPGQFDAASYYQNEGYTGILNAEKIRIVNEEERFSPDIYLHRLNLAISDKYKKILGDKNAGSLSAMVLGDKRGLDEEIKELYQENSISHLLSISGLHISLLGGAVFLFLRRLKVSFRFPLIASSIILIIYGSFTGFSVSTSRAVIMMSVLFISFAIGKSYDLPSGLALAALILIVINHRAIYQNGFLLSFFAVIGIFYIMPELLYIFKVDIYHKKGIIKGLHLLLASIISSISILLATLPIVLNNFYEVSLTGILLNIIVIPLMSLVVITGLLGGFVALVSEILGSFLLGITHYILNLYTLFCRLGDRLTFLRLIIGKPDKWQIVLYYLILVIVFYFLALKRRENKLRSLKNNLPEGYNTSKRIVVTGLMTFTSFLIIAYKPREFSINMLDIGQGDCFVVNDGNNDIYISDCGSTTVQNVGKTRLLPFLKSKGWGKVDTIFISHMDKDHVNGVNDLLKCAEITIGRIIISASYKSDKLNCAELEELKERAKMRDIKLFYMKKGDEIVGKDISFRCIYPTGEEDIKDQNEASIVMRMDYKGLSMLFTGDIAGSTEEKIIEGSDEDILDCDILKVCHHGSKNSSTDDFLKKVSPKLYLISCGLMNRYGHPHRDALSRMTEEGGRILRTDHMGGTQIKLADGKLIITKAGKNLTGKRFSPAVEGDCEDCERIKVNTHLVKP
jgi:DNA internalization competence protein ComEC/Rec2-like protein